MIRENIHASYEHMWGISARRRMLISNNAKIWGVPAGRTTDSSCNPPQVGVASTPTVATVNGQLEVFVGGGDAHFYALNASNGSLIWKTSLGSSPSNFIWDSPALYNGSIYIGISSFGDCPFGPGENVSTERLDRSSSEHLQCRTQRLHWRWGMGLSNHR